MGVDANFSAVSAGQQHFLSSDLDPQPVNHVIDAEISFRGDNPPNRIIQLRLPFLDISRRQFGALAIDGTEQPIPPRCEVRPQKAEHRLGIERRNIAPQRIHIQIIARMENGEIVASQNDQMQASLPRLQNLG